MRPRKEGAPRTDSDWDDGRTIADMSDVGRPGLWHFAGGQRRRAGADDGSDTSGAPGPLRREKRALRQNYEQPFTKKERLLCALGALKAALLIALAYIVGLGLVILLLMWMWK